MSRNTRESFERYSPASSAGTLGTRESGKTKSKSHFSAHRALKKNLSEGSDSKSKRSVAGDGLSDSSSSSSSKHVFFFLVLVIFFGIISVQGLAVVLRWQESVGDIVGHSSLFVISGASAIWSFSLCISCFQQSRSTEEQNDWTLVFLSLIFPAVLLVARFNPLPTSDDSKVNCIITYAFLLRLGALVDLPPAHSLVQILLSFPLFTYLDYNRRCQDPSSYPDTCTYLHLCAENGTCPIPQHCCHIISFLHHLVTRGILMLVSGSIAVSVPVILAIKMKKENLLASTITSSKSGSQREEAQEIIHVEDPPLESLGFNILSLTRTEGIVLLVKGWLERISDLVNESVLVSIVCIPIGFYYFGHTLLCRVMPKIFTTHAVSSDEWLLALSIFFVLGRESGKIDMTPAMLDVQEKLKVSHEILQDVLPPHVVDLLVNQKDEGEAEEEGEEEAEGEAEECLLGAEDGIIEEIPLGSDSLDTSPMRSKVSFKLKTVDEALVSEEKFDRQGSVPSTHESHVSLRAHPSGSLPHRRSIDSSGWRTALGNSPNGSMHRTLTVAENHDCVTVFFSDIVGFSSWSHCLPASKVMETLNDLYTRLDDVILNEMPGLYKVETIGDAYMVAGNLTAFDAKHAATVVQFAMRAQQEASKVPRPDVTDGSTLQLRIGIHSGPAVTGIVGKIRRRFCMFGDTINMASRTETSCPPGCIQVTEQTQALALPHISRDIIFRDCGLVQVKGSSEPLRMYLVISKQALLATQGLLAAAAASVTTADNGPTSSDSINTYHI